MQTRSALLASLVALSACGSPTPEAPAAQRATATPPARATEPAPAPPAEIASCTLAPSRVIATNRRRPRIVVGVNGAAVVHRSRRPVQILDGQCEVSRAIATSPFPFTDAGFTDVALTAPCTAEPGGADVDVTNAAYARDATLFADVAREGDTAFTLRCDSLLQDESLDTVRCAISAVGGAYLDSFFIDSPASEVDLVKVGFGVGRAGDARVFSLAFAGTEAGDGVFAIFEKGAERFHTERLGRPPTAMDLDDPRHFVMGAVPSPEGGYVFEHGATVTTRRVRTVLGPRAERVGVPAPVTITAPAPAELDVDSARPDPRGLSSLRLLRAGVPAPIEGVSTTIATFGADFVRVGARVLVVFSEGTGNTTRIRGAIVDPVTARVVGDVFDVSTAGHEAGYATIDALGANGAIAWDEKSGSDWQVRVAALTCR